MLQNRNIKLGLGIIGIILLGYVLWNVRDIIYYFFAAAIIAFIARPLMRILGRVRIKNWVAPNWLKAAIVLGTFIIIIVSLISLIIPTVAHQADIIGKIDTQVLIEKLQPQIQSATHWLEKSNISQAELEETLQQEAGKIFSIGDVRVYVQGIIGGLANSLIASFSILFISFFLLKDGSIVDSVIHSISPDKYLEKIKTILADTKDLLTRYFIGVLVQVSIVILIITIGLSILGVENALLIGVVAGIFNIIPYVGPIIGALIGIILAATSQIELNPDLQVSSFIATALIPFAVAQALDNFVLQPVIFSKSVKAHPLEIFIVILIAGSLGGIIGMIIAVPGYSFLRIVAKEFFNGYKVVQGLTKNI